MKSIYMNLSTISLKMKLSGISQLKKNPEKLMVLNQMRGQAYLKMKNIDKELCLIFWIFRKGSRIT